MKTLTIPLIELLPDADMDSTCLQVAQCGAVDAIDCVNWPEEYPYTPSVRFHAAYTATHILILFEVDENGLRAKWMNDNDAVWEDSCVEFFVQTPSNPCYFNFETNCIGTGLAARRLSRNECTHFDREQMQRVIRHSSLPHRPIDSDEPCRWNLLLGVPFELVGCRLPPERLRANLYKCGDCTAVPHFLSWNPVATAHPDFHRPEYFADLILKR